jgi:hypothetical protein
MLHIYFEALKAVFERSVTFLVSAVLFRLSFARISVEQLIAQYQNGIGLAGRYSP